MKKAIGMYAWLIENEANEPTLFSGGEPIDGGVILNVAEEGIAGVSTVLGHTQMTVLDLGDEENMHKLFFDQCDNFAPVMARDLGKRIELVRFGENGREHVKWYEPNE